MRTLPCSAGTDVAAQCLNALLRERRLRRPPATAADDIRIHITLSQTRAIPGFSTLFLPNPASSVSLPGNAHPDRNMTVVAAVTFPQLADLILERPVSKRLTGCRYAGAFKHPAPMKAMPYRQAIDFASPLGGNPRCAADVRRGGTGAAGRPAFHPALKSHGPF